MNDSNVEIRFIKYGNELIPVQEGTSIEELKAGMVALYPELEDAVLHTNEGGIGTFFVEAGDKGYN